jgi:hypothetical protein
VTVFLGVLTEFNKKMCRLCLLQLVLTRTSLYTVTSLTCFCVYEFIYLELYVVGLGTVVYSWSLVLCTQLAFIHMPFCTCGCCSCAVVYSCLSFIYFYMLLVLTCCMQLALTCAIVCS